MFVESDTTVRYDAGAGAPWADACQVPVRLDGQDDWTYLSVPITIVPLDPQPELHPASLTVGPGETATFDLTRMTSWQLREDWDGIQYAFEQAGGAFEVTQEGSILTITGADTAVPGAEDVALVSVTSHPAVPPARLILRVGAAPSTLPQGASVTQQCSQAAGSSCVITVVGGPGEVNPLPRTPLEVVEVRADGSVHRRHASSAHRRRPSWRRGRRIPRGRRAPHRSRSKTHRAAGRTPIATAGCFSICRASPGRLRASCRLPTTTAR